MELADHIEYMYDTFSKGEKKIADYVRAYPEEVVAKSIYELADCIGVSTASISRFVKKIGEENINSFKVKLIREYTLHGDNPHKVDEMLNWKMDFDTLSEVLPATVTEVCQDVFSINEKETFQLVIRKLSKAPVIHITGSGSSAAAAKEFQHKLLRIRKRSVYLDESPVNLHSFTFAGLNDVLVVISFDGERGRLLEIVNVAQRRGMCVVAITRCASSRLAELADYCLYVPNLTLPENNLASIFRKYGQMQVIDIVYIGLAKAIYKNPEIEIKENMKRIEDLYPDENR